MKATQQQRLLMRGVRAEPLELKAVVGAVVLKERLQRPNDLEHELCLRHESLVLEHERELVNRRHVEALPEQCAQCQERHELQ